MITSVEKNRPSHDIAFILDHHLLFAESFASLLKTIKLFTQIQSSDTENDLFIALKKTCISHVFLDYSIAGLNTGEVISNIKRVSPSTRIIIIGSTDNIFLVRQMLAVKAQGFITKHTATYEIERCIWSVRIGRLYIAGDLKKLMNGETEIFQPLHFTNKEMQILQFIAKGHTIGETASALYLSRHTVVAHRRKIMRKSGLNTATALVKFAYEAGLVE